ncbi:MAG: PAS domain-containing protein, partial [Endomicrobium sp.]|nr:PAS domain-containing protein [Endomicrobium sp.]
MSTERLVKWSKESQEFFEKAEDNSIVLDLVISYACASQTGEGFEELVNTINSESIKRKVKKVVITDTSYLYRHTIPQFSGYCDTDIPTEWKLKNIDTIKKLTVATELKSWFTGLDKDGFNDWYTKIKKDFFMDSNFKDAVIKLAMEFTAKNFYDTDIGRNIDFILEETTYTAFNLNDANVVYPTEASEPVRLTLKKYNLGTKFLSYRISNHACEDTVRILNRTIVDREVIKFVKEKPTNINFFVVDRGGNIIYMNQSLCNIVSEENAKQVAQTTWQNSLKVMDKRTTLEFEEHDKDRTFLSIKSPLIINGKVEGVIGLSIDITERKKAEELEKKLAIQKELYEVAKGVSHDICSPISA